MSLGEIAPVTYMGEPTYAVDLSIGVIESYSVCCRMSGTSLAEQDWERATSPRVAYHSALLGLSAR
jgi:hypothetical protein